MEVCFSFSIFIALYLIYTKYITQALYFQHTGEVSVPATPSLPQLLVSVCRLEIIFILKSLCKPLTQKCSGNIFWMKQISLYFHSWLSLIATCAIFVSITSFLTLTRFALCITRALGQLGVTSKANSCGWKTYQKCSV
jgi:hypothetical protein